MLYLFYIIVHDLGVWDLLKAIQENVANNVLEIFHVSFLSRNFFFVELYFGLLSSKLQNVHESQCLLLEEKSEFVD